jgi:lantibiotic modifying enzyme
MRMIQLRTGLGIGVAIGILCAGGVSIGGSGIYQQAALDAARWIRGTSIRTSAGLTWPGDPRDPKSVSTALYSGSPGVILFLLELHEVTGQAEYLADAKAGADELLAQLPSMQQTGLYTGIAGVGFTLGEVHRATGEAKYRDGLAAVVATLKDRAVETGAGMQWSEVTDIIAGNAGTGLFLLDAARRTNDAAALRLAARAADRLIEVAIPEHGGLKWAMDPKFARLMPNFSHGTAGIAYYLARVYEETKDRKYLDASLAGAKYLQAIARTDGDICLIQHNQPQGLELYYLGWCHGPVGTARLWRQLSIVTGDKTWDQWVDRSARGILQSGIPGKLTDGFWNNVSQCCGSAGVGQFFLDLHRTRSNPRYLAFAKTMTADLLKRGTRDEQGLRWVQAEHRVQPRLLVAQTGYMQGAAGIGMWLLRLDAAETRRNNFIRFPDTPF